MSHLVYPNGDPVPKIPVTIDVPPDKGEVQQAASLKALTSLPASVTGRSVSGFPPDSRILARDRVVEAALLGLRHASELHYTQGARRWDGIDKDLRARRGEFPRYADCSAFATWCLWNAVHLSFGAPDRVNGTSWRYGSTYTMHLNGRRVARTGLQRGDLVLYGRPGVHRTHHVAVYIGGGMVISFGSERGPFKLLVGYRQDILATRRYI